MSSLIVQDLDLATMKAYRSKLQEMYFSGITQSSFQGQTIIFRNQDQIRKALVELAECIDDSENGADTRKKAKRITLTSTKNRGF